MYPIVGEIGTPPNPTVVFLITPSHESIVHFSTWHGTEQIQRRSFNLTIGQVNRVPVTVFFHQSKSVIVSWLIDGIETQHFLNANPKRLAFVSCDLPEGDATVSLWDDLVGFRPHLCCHIGDNIYGDAEYHSKNPKYDQLYQEVWNRWAPKFPDTSHLMIADDHEVTDGYQYGKLIGPNVDLALDSYRRYQESLLLAPRAPGVIVKHLCSEKNLVMISRTICQGDLVDTLSTAIQNLTGDLIVAYSSAPVLLPDSLFGRVYTLFFGTTGWDRETLTRLYDCCFEYLLRNPERKLILIGGDLHFGIKGTVSNGEVSFPVYVSSAITNAPTPVESLTARLLTGTQQIGPYTVELTARADRNYLQLLIPTMEARLIYNDHFLPANISKYLERLWNMLG